MKNKRFGFILFGHEISFFSFQFLKLFVTIFLLNFSLNIEAQNNIEKSAALEQLLEQVEKEYVPQKWKTQLKWDMDSVAKVIPTFYFKIVGYAMFNQKKNIKLDSKAYDKLNDEILSLIPEIANAYNEANYNSNKSQNPDWIKGHYLNATNGGLDEEFRQSYNKHAGKKIAQINFPYVLDKEHGPVFKKAARKNNGILLLGEEVLPENSRKDLGKPIKSGLKCPLKGSKWLVEIDTNDNPDDKNLIKCYYYDELLFEQESFVKGYKHGEYFKFYYLKDKPHHIEEHGVYNNGKKDGDWKEYAYYKETGRVLDTKTTYKNGIRTYLESWDFSSSLNDIYLSHIAIYDEGNNEDGNNILESKGWYDNGRMAYHVYYKNRIKVSEREWWKDGTPK